MTLKIPQVSEPDVQAALDTIAQRFPLRFEDFAGTTGLSVGAFSAFRNAALTLATGGFVTFDAETGESFDDSGWHLNGAYQPKAPVKVHVYAQVAANPAPLDSWMQLNLRKNAVAIKSGPVAYQRGAGLIAFVDARVKMNGTTDVLDVQVAHNVAAPGAVLIVGALNTYWHGEVIGPL